MRDLCCMLCVLRCLAVALCATGFRAALVVDSVAPEEVPCASTTGRRAAPALSVSGSAWASVIPPCVVATGEGHLVVVATTAGASAFEVEATTATVVAVTVTAIVTVVGAIVIVTVTVGATETGTATAASAAATDHHHDDELFLVLVLLSVFFFSSSSSPFSSKCPMMMAL